MFSKNGSNIFIAILFGLFGSMCTYIACQYQFLKIDTEVKVIETLLSLGTIVLGLYIVLVIDRNRSRSQNFYSYVESKYDKLWEEFIQFSEVIELSPRIELKETSKAFKHINQKLTPLIKIFESSEYDSECLKKIENKIDELEDFVSNHPDIQDKVLDLTKDKANISQKLVEINELFATSFKELSVI